ncbi:transposase family protein [Streptomyces sp. NBC_00233]|uniref:transposase family protein n=1 Tax=Streptomyces sp. NBC_00233 TaxID=2975686 RepID=UPI00339048AF
MPGVGPPFRQAFVGRESMGDPGYIKTGMLTARRKPPGRDQPATDKIFNQNISKLRAAVERAVAHLKDWKIPATAALSPTFPALSRPSPPSPSTRRGLRNIHVRSCAKPSSPLVGG